MCRPQTTARCAPSWRLPVSPSSTAAASSQRGDPREHPGQRRRTARPRGPGAVAAHTPTRRALPQVVRTAARLHREGECSRCPRSARQWGRRESNPHYGRFKRPASAGWATSPVVLANTIGLSRRHNMTPWRLETGSSRQPDRRRWSRSVPGRPRPRRRCEDPRLSDVDEWGRSEHMRALARRIYGPLYRQWFRVEWEGLEKIPTSGGALLVANHAAAIPSDAPVIMHGIEEELGRPVYGLADHIFKAFPVVGTLWARVGWRGRPPRERLPPAAGAAAARPGVPGGHQGSGQALPGALPAPALRAGRVRGDGHAGRRAHRAHRRGGGRGVDADPRQGPGAGPRPRACPTSR